MPQLGAGVQGHSIGQKRAILRGDMGVSRWGTFAELVAVPAESLIEIPEGWTEEQAGSASLVYVTAFQALTQWEDLPAQAVVLVSGASGGVGVASTQLGVAMGHTVIGLSRGSEKHATLKSLGAALVLDPADPQWRKTLAEFLGKRKVDLAIDSVGGTLFPQLIATLGDRGRVSVVGRLAGEVPQFNTATLVLPAHSNRRRRRRRVYESGEPSGVERVAGSSEQDGRSTAYRPRLSIRPTSGRLRQARRRARWEKCLCNAVERSLLLQARSMTAHNPIVGFGVDDKASAVIDRAYRKKFDSLL